MAANAAYADMFAGQFKSGPRMFKPGFIPASGVVTCRTSVRNPFCKLVPMDIFVAGLTGHLFLPPEGPYLLPSSQAFRVAPVARNCRMSVRKVKAGVPVRCGRVESRAESRFPVTGLAESFVRPGGKLATMGIDVAVATMVE
jgi:hypothetical protein